MDPIEPSHRVTVSPGGASPAAAASAQQRGGSTSQASKPDRDAAVDVSATNVTGGSADSLAGHLSAESARIQIELERLKTRRRLIEEQRRALAAATPPAAHADRSALSNRNDHTGRSRDSAPPHGRSTSANSFRDPVVAADLTNIITHEGDLPPGGTSRKPILPEPKRRRLCINNPHFQMKEAIRDALQHDSTIVSGSFMPNPHTSRAGTFTRAVRFAKPVGVTQQYYLSYETQQLAGPNCRNDRRVLTASMRGRVGTNVNSHWNDVTGGVAPGPGAYTPRFWFCSGQQGAK